MYRAAIEYVGWAYRFCESLKGHRNAKDQLLRASQAIPLNIAEATGRIDCFPRYSDRIKRSKERIIRNKKEQLGQNYENRGLTANGTHP